MQHRFNITTCEGKDPQGHQLRSPITAFLAETDLGPSPQLDIPLTITGKLVHVTQEQLLKFDGTPLFPERRAYTVSYKLSDAEAQLYKEVTDYVREEFNRADALESEGRKGTVGFALTILQRRLASSPEAIYQSLRRRRERLEKRLREEKLLKRGGGAPVQVPQALPSYTEEDLEELEDAPSAEIEETGGENERDRRR